MTASMGQMVSGDIIAARYQYNSEWKYGSAIGWRLHMPMSDRKSQMVVPGATWKYVTRDTIESILEHDHEPAHNEVWWGHYQFTYTGVYIGQKMKQEGIYDYIGYEDGNILNHFKRRMVRLGTVAIRGTRGSFLLVYVPLDKNGEVVT